jgi:hypothetical protein
MSTAAPDTAGLSLPPTATPPKRRKGVRIALALLGVLALMIAGSLLFGREYATTQTARRTFTIDQDFTDVRKILVRTNASKQIVTMGGDSEFISQDLMPTEIGAGKIADELLNPDWHIELRGTLHVRTKDPYVGQFPLDLNQHVEIKPDFLHSEVHSEKPAGRLQHYDMKTSFDRDPKTGKAVVSLELTQEILTDAPWFAHGIADRRVRASAERTLANQENAIRKLIDENKDNIPIFPLR